jgi:glycosyltransferase involved in cell wall biosynthesis
VASDAAALPEVCGTAAKLVEARSPDALADALGKVLTDTKVRECLRDAGLDRAARFTWAETATQTRSVYEAVWED